jgi:cell division protein FtsX
VGRRQEIAVRLSVGVSRIRLLRLFMAEGLVLTLFGGAAGIAVTSSEVTDRSSSFDSTHPGSRQLQPDVGNAVPTDADG